MSRQLLFDIGNTRIKWGLLVDGELRRTGAIAHDKLRTDGIESLTRKLPKTVSGAAACNVAGADFGKRFARAIGMHIGGDLRYVHSERSACGVTNGYRQPRSLGVDRWVAMIGARTAFRTALCVVDAGTAITIDAMDKAGQHLGGQIIPGLELMGEALRSDTSDIGAAKSRVRDPAAGAAPFGQTTDRAIRCGALNAVCGAVERSARSLKSKGHRPKIVLTGGDASRILAQISDAVVHRPHLVLQGLATMTQKSS